jgi:hypothetical protein
MPLGNHPEALRLSPPILLKGNAILVGGPDENIGAPGRQKPYQEKGDQEARVAKNAQIFS